jgi:spore germination cell wall hydrolase CwlJ-like protein
MINIIVAVIALTVTQLGHAEVTKDDSIGRQMYEQANNRINSLVGVVTTPIIDTKELSCLARNIFYEAANEPEEGKVAVGLVTLNRAQDGRFRNTVCGVVDQKLSRDIPRTQVVEKKTMWRTEKVEQTIWSKISVCQFSWRCMFVKTPKSDDERWLESQRIAKELLADNTSFWEYRDKYTDALYFHATAIKPSWARQKEKVEKIGGHVFYKERVVAKY